MKKLLLGSLIIFAAAIVSAGQARQTENTIKLAPGQKSEKASIADMAWLAGTWTGEGFGSEAEETWNKPKGGVMIGMFRLTKDEKPVFYEFMTLEETDGSLVMRVKHFHGNLVAWEEREKTVDFKFVKKDKNRLYFEGLTFEVAGPDAVTLYLAMSGKNGSVSEETFRYTRVK